MNNTYNRKNIFSSFIWKFMGSSGQQVISLVVQILLARLLSPEEFGTMAIVLVFVNLAQVIVDGGFNTALIQKKEVDDLDYSSALITSVGISVILYILLFIFAPNFATFYGDANLILYLRTIGIIFIINAIYSIQIAYNYKRLQFKITAQASIVATIISGFIGLVMAYFGMGIWSLIIQQISSYFINVLIMLFITKWFPKFAFSLERFKDLFGYGSKILISSLIYRAYLESRTLVIGKFYSSSALGFYQRGEQFPRVVVNNIDGTIQSVMLPTLSNNQENIPTLKSMTRRAVKTSCFLIFPMMFGMAATSKNIVEVVLGSQWSEAIPFLFVFSLTYSIWPLITINQQPMKALGRSDLILKTEILKRVIGITIILLTARISVMAITIGFFFERFIEAIINSIPNKKLINYSLIELFRDVAPSLLLAFAMGVFVFVINFIPLNSNLLILIIQLISGAIFYFGGAIFFKNSSFIYLIGILRSYKK